MNQSQKQAKSPYKQVQKIENQYQQEYLLKNYCDLLNYKYDYLTKLQQYQVYLEKDIARAKLKQQEGLSFTKSDIEIQQQYSKQIYQIAKQPINQKQSTIKKQQSQQYLPQNQRVKKKPFDYTLIQKTDKGQNNQNPQDLINQLEEQHQNIEISNQEINLNKKVIPQQNNQDKQQQEYQQDQQKVQQKEQQQEVQQEEQKEQQQKEQQVQQQQQKDIQQDQQKDIQQDQQKQQEYQQQQQQQQEQEQEQEQEQQEQQQNQQEQEQDQEKEQQIEEQQIEEQQDYQLEEQQVKEKEQEELYKEPYKLNRKFESNEIRLQKTINIIKQLQNISSNRRQVDEGYKYYLREIGDFNTLCKHYSIQKLIDKQNLKKHCNKIQFVRGDGNCFYTAFMYQLLIQLLFTYNLEKYDQFIQFVFDKKIQFKINYNDFQIDDQELLEEFLYQLQQLRLIEQEEDRKQQLSSEFIQYMIQENGQGCFHDLSTIFLRNLCDTILEFSEMKDQCLDRQNLLIWEAECNNNEIVVQALAKQLGIHIKLIFFSKGNFVIQDYEQGCQNQIILLIQPGHYNIGYNQ